MKLKNRKPDKPDTPIVFGSGEREELYCNIDHFKLVSSDNFVYTCSKCGARYMPSSQDVSRETTQETMEGKIYDGQINPNPEPLIGYAPEPSLSKKKVEYKGGIGALAQKGTIRITNYSESNG